MDMYPPTAADYAMSAAENAAKENRGLKERVSELERKVEYLMMRDGDRGFSSPFGGYMGGVK